MHAEPGSITEAATVLYGVHFQPLHDNYCVIYDHMQPIYHVHAVHRPPSPGNAPASSRSPEGSILRPRQQSSGEMRSIAVAVTCGSGSDNNGGGGKGGRRAVQWAVDNLIPQADRFILVHVIPRITSIPTPSGG